MQLVVLARIMATDAERPGSSFSWARGLKTKLVLIDPTAFVKKMTEAVILQAVQNASTAGKNAALIHMGVKPTLHVIQRQVVWPDAKVVPWTPRLQRTSKEDWPNLLN